jgi:hypothetical protein
MTAPWKCPDCGEWQAPAVTSHRCAQSSTPEPSPDNPPGHFGHLAGSFERTWQPTTGNRFGFRADLPDAPDGPGEATP